jgi:hypothetical protein
VLTGLLLFANGIPTDESHFAYYMLSKYVKRDCPYIEGTTVNQLIQFLATDDQFLSSFE